MRLTTRPSIRLSLALLIAATISCNDTVTGPALEAPDGSILLSDSVFTRGATVRASVNAPAGFTLVPGSVEWSVSSATATLTNVGADDDSVDVALRVAGPMRLTARYRLRSTSGAGSSITIAAPTSRSGGEVWVDAGRAFDVATPILDYVAVPPGSVGAGASLGTVQVALKDIRGRIITAATDSVVIALDPTSGSTGATLLGTLRARPVDGIATFPGTSIQRAGTGYRLIASSPTLTARDTTTTTIVAGAATAGQSTFAIADTILTVGGTSTVTVTLRDQYGNPVLTATPAAFVPAGTAGTLGTFTCTNGICTATYTAPSAPATPVLTATVGGTAIPGAPRPVTVRAGAAAKLVITGDSTQIAGTSQPITVTARDLYGNVATGYTGAKRLTFSGASLAPIGTAPTIAATAVQKTADLTFASGVATVVPSVLVKAETAILAATDGTISAAGTDRLPVQVTANTPDALQSIIVVADTVRIGGQTTTVTITLRDAWGNPVLNGTADNFTPAVSGGTIGAFTCVSGVCTATYDTPRVDGPQQVTATIGGATVGTTPVTVAVTVDATAPTLTGPSGGAGAAASAKSIAENTTAIHTFTANESVTWKIVGGADSAAFAIDPTTGALRFVNAPNFEAPTDRGDGAGDNTYVVIVSATDVAGNISRQTVTVTVTNVDETAPAITGPSGAAGAEASAKSIPENTTAVHTFSASEEVTWSLGDGADAAKFAIDPVTGALTFKAAPDFEAPSDSDANNTYVVVVRATDAAGNISLQTVTVTITNADETAPTITGPNDVATSTTGATTKSIPENTTAVHTFTANETVTWSVSGGADAAKFGINATTGALAFLAAPNFEAPTDLGDGAANNTYVVTVKATDAAGNATTMTVTVTVTNVDETTPRIAGPSGSAGATASAKSIPEGTTAVHTFTASEEVTWTLGGGVDAAKFAINPATGALTLRATPDFEAPTDADGNNTYIVVVTATDAGGNVSSQTVTVTITDIDDTAPSITGPSGAAAAATSAKSIAENTTAVHTFTANESVTWSLTGGADAGKFTINATTGALTFTSAPDFEAPTDLGDGATNNTYVVIVKAVDAAGNISTQTVTVTVTDVDDTPASITGPSGAAGAATSAKSIAENTTAVHTFTANESVTWSLDGGADAAKFSINATTGALSFTVAPNFEAPNDAGDGANNNTYVVVIKAVDALGNASTQTVTITVTDVDEVAPVITGPSGAAGATTSAKSIAENTTAVHTFTANESVTWSLDGGADAAKFTINATTGALTFIAGPDFESPTDADGNNTYIVVVKAVDALGNVSTQTLTVTITNVDETAPAITGPSGAAGAATSAKSIAENTTAVHTFTASEDVTWSLDGGADAAKFSINAATGALTFKVAPDFEAPNDAGDGANNNTYVVVIKAVDVSGLVSTQTVTVTVTNVDDTAPAITGPSGAAGAAISAKSIAENTTAVHTFTANESVTWSLDGGADAAKFSIDATTGALGFLSAPNFEAPTDAGDGANNNTYVVVIKAVDAAGLISTQTVTVTVTNVDETTGAFSRVVCTESQPAGQSAAASVTVTLCAATRAGDLEIVTLALDGTDDVTAPSGGLDGTWTKISSVSQSSGSGGNKSMLLINYARRYADGLNRTVTFTGATNHKWSVDMVTFVSAGTGVPTGAEIQTSQNATGSSLTSPGLTATAENTIVYYVMANSLTGNTVSATNQGTLTSLSNNNSGGTSSTAFIELLASSATAPSRTWTSTKSANSVLLQLLVRP